MRILFVVCGEGLGHSSRCIHLGHYLEQHGHSVSYVAYGKSYDFLCERGCATVYKGLREVCLDGTNGFFSLKKTLLCSKWIPFDLVRSALRVRRLIMVKKIDCVICDTMYGGVMAARFRRVPVIFVTNQNRFVGYNGQKNPIWYLLNFLIRRYLCLTNTIIVPDYDPPVTVSEFNLFIPNHERNHYHFTGPFLDVDLSRFRFSEETVFASFGGEPYKLPLYLLLREIADSRKDLVFDVFYTGEGLPESSGNFLSHGYVPNLYEHLAKARIAIVHGGLTTLHEALLFGKPVLVIVDSGHPEQQNNAKKIVDMGVGVAVDGRRITREILEQKIADTLALPVRNPPSAEGEVAGRKTATEIIENVALGCQRKFLPIFHHR